MQGDAAEVSKSLLPPAHMPPDLACLRVARFLFKVLGQHVRRSTAPREHSWSISHQADESERHVNLRVAALRRAGLTGNQPTQKPQPARQRDLRGRI